MKINFITFGDKEGKRGSTRIRVLNMMSALQKKGWICAFNDENIDDYDLIFFQKTTLQKKIKNMIKQARLKKIPIVLDLDDYSKILLSSLKYFDMITVSTTYLKSLCDQYHPNVVIIPNMLDIKDINLPLKEKNKHKSIVWYGYSQNSYILEKWKIEGVKKISEKKGDIPYKADKIDEQLQQFDLVVIPQEQNEITLAKTHCRMLKAIYLGIPCLISDLPVYLELAEELDFPRDFIVTNPDDWNQKIADFKSGELKFEFDFEVARKKIIQKYGEENIADIFRQTMENFLKEEHIPLSLIREESVLISAILSADSDSADLIKSMESLLKQTLFDIEIILVGKKIPEQIVSFAKQDKRISFNKIPEGKYVYFLNAGDWLEKDGLKHLCAAMEISGADVVMMKNYITSNDKINLISVDDYGKLITNMQEVPEFLDYPLTYGACLYRKAFLTSKGIILPDLSAFPEIEFIYQVFKKCQRLYIIPKTFIHCNHKNLHHTADAKVVSRLLKECSDAKLSVSGLEAENSVVLIIRNQEQLLPTFITLQSIIKNISKKIFVNVYSAIQIPSSLSMQFEACPNVRIHEISFKIKYLNDLSLLFDILLSPSNNKKVLYISNSCLAMSNLEEIFEIDDDVPIHCRKPLNISIFDTNVMLINVAAFKKSFESYPYIKQKINNSAWYFMMYSYTAEMLPSYNYRISEFADITPDLLAKIKILCYDNKKPWKSLRIPFGFLWWQYARKNTFYESLLLQLPQYVDRNLSLREKVGILKSVNKNQDAVYGLMIAYIKETLLWLLTFGKTASEHKIKITKISRQIQEKVVK